MELATIRPDLVKVKPEGEGDTLILTHSDKPYERLIKNIIFANMLGRKMIKKPKYHRDLTSIQTIN